MVSIVTGAGTGIGRATALALAAAGGPGSAVVLAGRRVDSLQETASLVERAGARPIVEAADVGEPADVERIRGSAEEQGGAVDVLVNNAGVNVPARALDRLKVGDWEQILHVNATGPFLMTRAVLPGMRARRRGTIVNVSSLAGIRPGRLAGPAYSAAKAALISFTESINASERRYGIRACAVCPGEVATPILDDRPVPPPPAARELMLQPEDVASTIVHVVTLPGRALIDLVTILPTAPRDSSAEITD
ncbi:MAG: SDR family NAD(P)-dependent oxidoreductase [Candidatus Dormibacteraeota bacterium]|nr:SDR family NAD(P)-dependent oxidoreductase [Candidatus Dormibacteraeota bacterium]MBO0743911.1 SDR family NAD(P)-dependent oxidoreductase [Candidatus Dormibacteraeota bacterium]